MAAKTGDEHTPHQHEEKHRCYCGRVSSRAIGLSLVGEQPRLTPGSSDDYGRESGAKAGYGPSSARPDPGAPGPSQLDARQPRG